MSKVIRAYSLNDDAYHEYVVPSKTDALKHSEQTWGSHYDRIERRQVEGGIAMLWPRVAKVST